MLGCNSIILLIVFLIFCMCVLVYIYGYTHLCAWDIYVHVCGGLKLLLDTFINDSPFYLLRQSLLMSPELNESWSNWHLTQGFPDSGS